MLPTSSVSIGTARESSAARPGWRGSCTASSGAVQASAIASRPWTTSCSTNVKPRVAEQVLDVLGRPVTKLSTHDDLVAALDQDVAQVRAEEAGATGDDGDRASAPPTPS